MRYSVEVDNDRQVLLRIEKERLEWLYSGIMGSDDDARMPMMFLMTELGLLDERFEPTWR